jgi:glutathione peroxidase-family protein
MTDLYSITAESITGDSISLSEYRDQALLVVNLASQ